MTRDGLRFSSALSSSTEVRGRIYVIGPALALLLDRFQPRWQESLEADDHQSLDQILETALTHDRRLAEAQCEFAESDIDRIERAAHRDAAAVEQQQVERRKEFDSRSGWRLIVRAADTKPLWLRGFDPLNVHPVQGGVLHTRALSLGNDTGALQAIDEGSADIEALTVAVGPHPLFNGVRSVEIAGVSKPEIHRDRGGVTLEGAGLKLSFLKALVSEDGSTTIIQLSF